MATKKKAQPEGKEYTATVIVFGKKYEAKGSSIPEAISALKVPNAKGRCILTLKCGDKMKDRLIPPMITQRLFNSQGITRDIFLKNASMLFAGFDN